MKPPPFEYHRPEAAEQALDVLASLGEEARPLAGGQSLVPLMNMRLARPGHLVDLNRCRELDYVRLEDGELRVGALARQRRLELDAAARRACPLLPLALAHVGHPGVRNRGTVCGSLAHADPAAELPAVALALDARLVLRRRGAERVVAAADFFRGPFTAAAEPDELLVEARFPLRPGRVAFAELARRQGDFAVAGVAAVLRLDGDVIAEARLGLLGVAPGPRRARRAEEALAGARPAPDVFRRAGALAAEDAEPVSDLTASADHRRQLVEVLVARALEGASAGFEAGR